MTGAMKASPAPPDYTGATEAQARASRQNIIEQTFANRPDVYTPWGSMTWEQPNYPGEPNYASQDSGAGTGPGGIRDALLGKMQVPGQSDPGSNPPDEQVGNGTAPAPPPGGTGYDPRNWRMNVNLDPRLQAAVDAQMAMQQGRSEFGQNVLMPQMYETLQRDPFTGVTQQVTGGEAARNAAEEALYGRATSRLDPRFERQQVALEDQLANQGIFRGTPAYAQAMDEFNRSKTDAYQTAMREAITGGGAEATRQYGLEAQNRQRQLAEEYQRQYGPLNAMQAALAGQQVNMPQFPSFNQAGVGQAPQYLQAAQLGYQGALDQFNAQQGGLQGLLGGFGGMLPFML